MSTFVGPPCGFCAASERRRFLSRSLHQSFRSASATPTVRNDSKVHVFTVSRHLGSFVAHTGQNINPELNADCEVSGRGVDTQCLEHRHSFVRRNAVLAINAMYKLPKGEMLLQDAPELIEQVLQVSDRVMPQVYRLTSSHLSMRFRSQLTGLLLWLLQNEQDLSTRRNAFQFLTAVDQPRAIKYLMSQVKGLHQLVEGICQDIPFVGSLVILNKFRGTRPVTSFVE